MLKRLSAILVAAALSITAVRATAEVNPRVLEDLLEGTSVTSGLSGLQVSLLKNGQTAGSYAFGFAQIEAGKEVPLRRDHKVRVASISKLVVAIGVMQLVDSGQLNLDRDVSEYLGWELRNPAFPRTAITARQLLSHTSSVRDGSEYFIAAGEGEMRDFFTPGSDYWEQKAHFASDPNEAPGRYFVYSNLNFGLLGAVIERLSFQRFDQYMAKNVLKPMGLSARFDPCEVAVHQRAAAFRKGDEIGSWNPGGDWLAQVDDAKPRCFYGAKDRQFSENFLAGYELGSNATLYSPQGGLRASADDLVVVLQMLLNRGESHGKRILSAASVDAMFAPNWTLNEARTNGLSAGEAEPGGATEGLMASYGLSVHRIDARAWGFDKGPALLLGHLGEAYGVLSHALIDPETGDGIATIITGTAENPADSPPGSSPLYRIEEEILRWWLEQAH